MKGFRSPAELWSELDITGPLCEEVIQTDEFGDYLYHQVMFSGRQRDDGEVKIFGVYAHNKNLTKPAPCALLVHDFGAGIDFSYIDYFLSLGVSVLMCDTYGERAGERHTIFPPSLEHCNFAKNNAEDLTRDLDSSVWINTTLIFRYALKFLRTRQFVDIKKIGVFSFGLSSIVGFHLSFCEESLALCCNFHYGGWKGYDQHFMAIDSENAKYLMAVAPQAYSPIAKVPLFLLGSTNSQIADSDRIFDTFARCNGEVDNFFYLSTNYIATVDFFATTNLKLLIAKYLTDVSTQTLPAPPFLKVESENDVHIASLTCDSDDKIKNATLFYAEGFEQPQVRCYHSVPLAFVSDKSCCSVVELSPSLGGILHASVEFESGFTLTSNIVKITPFGEDTKYTGTICGGSTDCIFPLGSLAFPKANVFFSAEQQPTISVGAFDINGIFCPRLATFGIGKPTLKRKNKSLSVQLFSQLPQAIRLVVSGVVEHSTSYSATINLVGGEMWQKVILDPKDFTSSEMESLASFQDCKLMFFVPEYEFLLLSISLV